MNKEIFGTFKSLAASGSMRGNRTAKIIGTENIQTKRAVYPDPATHPQDYERELMRSARVTWRDISRRVEMVESWRRFAQKKKYNCTPYNALVREMRKGDLRSVNMLALKRTAISGRNWLIFSPSFAIYGQEFVRPKVTCYYALENSLGKWQEIELRYNFKIKPFGWRLDLGIINYEPEKYLFNLIVKKKEKYAIDNLSISGLYVRSA